MEYRVSISPRAERDIAHIASFIGVAESSTAAEWFHTLSETLRSLKFLPERGTALEFEPHVRQLLYGKKPHVYRVLYTVDKQKALVEILHVRHGKRLGSGLHRIASKGTS